jgi:osmotically-inducible protein OsmY
MPNFRAFATGAICGSIGIYLLDPERGRSRRSDVVQRTSRISRRTQRMLARRASIAAGRAGGLVHRARHRGVADRLPSDEKLLDRVRSEVFRSPDVPKGQVNINVEHGTVVLRGHVDSEAMRTRLEAATQAVKGVREVENLINAGS